jgi:hypothetical protein
MSKNKKHFVAPKFKGLTLYDEVGLLAKFDNIGTHGDLWVDEDDKALLKRLRENPRFDFDFFELDPNAPKPKEGGDAKVEEAKEQLKADLTLKFKRFQELGSEILNKVGNIKADTDEGKAAEYEALKTELGL